MLQNAELTIRANKSWEYEYEKSIIKGGLPEDEFTIKTDRQLLYEYNELMERAWQLAGSIINANSCECEKSMIKRRLPEDEFTIKTESDLLYEYTELMKRVWQLAESISKTDPHRANLYENVIE